MATPKGYSNDQKLDRGRAEFATVSPANHVKHALDVIDRGSVYQVGTDAAEASSTASVINATAHAAKKGDRIRFTSGVHSGFEMDVESVTTNTITLAGDLDAAVGNGDTFAILRNVSLTLNSSGAIQSTPGDITFQRDGGSQTVTEDTVTPANNRPLPVKLTDFSGDMVLNASNLNLEVQSSHTGATPDSIQIGDGTETVNVNASNEMQVRDDDANTLLTTIDADTSNLDVALSTRASESTLSTLNAKFVTGTDIGDVTINNAAGASAVNIQDGGNSITVDNADLSTLAGAVAGTEFQVDIIASLPAGTNNIGDVDIASALPAGTNTIGAVDTNYLDIVDQLDTPLTDATGINGSAGAFVEVVSSTAADVKKIQVMDTSGVFMGIYTGAAASEVLKFIYAPGSDQTIEVNIPSGTRISLRSMESAAPTGGDIAFNFLG